MMLEAMLFLARTLNATLALPPVRQLITRFFLSFSSATLDSNSGRGIKMAP